MSVQKQLEALEVASAYLNPAWTQDFNSLAACLKDLELPVANPPFGWYITETDTALIVPLGDTRTRAFVWNDPATINHLKVLISQSVCVALPGEKPVSPPAE